MRNVLDAVESQQLQHVHIVQGSKVYGSDLGPYKTPAQESDPRVVQTNWYYEQEDLLAQRSAGTAWQWSASRPHGVCEADAGAVRGLIVGALKHALADAGHRASTTVASAAPDSKPNRLMAAATASSKKFDAPMRQDGQATSCFSPSQRLSP